MPLGREAAKTSRDRRDRPARYPYLVEAGALRTTRVVLAAAHLDGNPANNRLRNLKSLCQCCHVLHDVPHLTRQRWITYRRRWALGDLFLEPYPVLQAERCRSESGWRAIGLALATTMAAWR